MPKPRKPKKGESFRLHLVVSGDLAVRIDAKAKNLTDQTPGATVTRSDVVRIAVEAYVGGRA